ncbi:hypothetical protein NM688_g7494 [Phlebia brevispora]|uniref:Uncharacterized protein n=1 Tax=Phlebia brevispora TaxID=194682 RepID=A0ACC1S4I9_9APHY|nr:hypothetical protein NM688_g7494 [Phlebia brevispora]
MERNISKFDISNPLSAFHFATVLLRLKASDRKLKDLFKAHESDFITMLASGTYKPWAKESPNMDEQDEQDEQEDLEPMEDDLESTGFRGARSSSALAPLPEDDELAEQVRSIKLN